MARVSKADSDLILEGRDFLQERESAESSLRAAFLEDLRFAFEPGAQWTEDARRRRQGRPNYSYNRAVGAINQLVGDLRMSQPGAKVRALNSKAPAKAVEIIGGMLRDIKAQSGFDRIAAEAFKYVVAGGWGVWRIVPEYTDEDSFEQVLRIKRVKNPLTVFLDEYADPWGRGAMRGMAAERISVDKYKALYGDKLFRSLPVNRDSKGWCSDKEVRIGELYKMDCRTKQIALLSDGRVMEWSGTLEQELAEMRASGIDAPTIERRRKVKQWFVTWVKMDGTNVLEGPIEYAYRHIPIIRAPGRFVNIEGEDHYQSLICHSKDAQRTYNYDRSNMVETTALTPRAPYIGTAKMFQGYEAEWSRANVSNQPFLRYNPDPDAPSGAGRPERQAGPEVPQAYMALAAHDAEDIRQTTGYFNPALDQQTAAGDAESGRALRTRLVTADSGSFEYPDNFAKAIEYTDEVLIDMLPVHYDTERTVRLLGMDGRESFETLDPDLLKKGKYEVTVTLGPAYATARMEALDTLLEASERMPIIAEVAPDIIIRNLDVQGADEIEQRVRLRLIQAGVVAPTEKDAEVMSQFPPQEPDPVQEQLTRRLAAQADNDEAKALKTKVETAAEMATADTALRREMLELQNVAADIKKTFAETALMLKELRAPRETQGKTT